MLAILQLKRAEIVNSCNILGQRGADEMTIALTIGWLYPRLMSTYGDRGNVICLQQRCQWRGLPVSVTRLSPQASLAAWEDIDLIVGGGAQDRQQELVLRDLQGQKAALLKAKLTAGVPGVFTCGSPQLLGHTYEPAWGQHLQGLGILDLTSKHPGPDVPRCIGNLAFTLADATVAREVAALADREAAPAILGFENHGGRTYLGQVSPLGQVLVGTGNNGEDGTEGALLRNALATYAHGPLLPKNPFLADWLIFKAIEVKYGRRIELAPLDDRFAWQARQAMLDRLGLPADAAARALGSPV